MAKGIIKIRKLNQTLHPHLALVKNCELITKSIKGITVNIINNHGPTPLVEKVMQLLGSLCETTYTSAKDLLKSQSSKQRRVCYLPPKAPGSPEYTLVLDLDETLVHYNEESGEAFILVRPGVALFLNGLQPWYEIIIFTAAVQNVSGR